MYVMQYNALSTQNSVNTECLTYRTNNDMCQAPFTVGDGFNCTGVIKLMCNKVYTGTAKIIIIVMQIMIQFQTPA